MLPQPPSSSEPEFNGTFATPLTTKSVYPIFGDTSGAGVIQIAAKLAALKPVSNREDVPPHMVLGVAVGEMDGNEYTPID